MKCAALIVLLAALLACRIPDPLPTPTRADVLRFLVGDDTNRHAYNVDTYNCLDFANHLVKDAQAAGFDASVWAIIFDGPPERGHAIVRFTTSSGYVWIEAIDDVELRAPAVGLPLCDLSGKCYEGLGAVEVLGLYPH